MDGNSTGTGPLFDAMPIARSLAEPEVFSTIFDRHFAAIHRYLARRVGSARADDLASQRFNKRRRVTRTRLEIGQRLQHQRRSQPAQVHDP
jgi:hypothetical protein